MKQQFLDALRERPADIAAWQVYADWLEEQGDATAGFIRPSLAFTAGEVGAADAETRLAEFEALMGLADPEACDLLSVYRAALPARFRVLGSMHIGDDPPREMFAVARTIASGFLEAGRVWRGANLCVGTMRDGRPRLIASMFEVMGGIHEELAAGRRPVLFALSWLGHVEIETGALLAEPVA